MTPDIPALTEVVVAGAALIAALLCVVTDQSGCRYPWLLLRRAMNRHRVRVMRAEAGVPPLANRSARPHAESRTGPVVGHRAHPRHTRDLWARPHSATTGHPVMSDTWRSHLLHDQSVASDLVLIENHFKNWTQFVWGRSLTPDAVAFAQRIDGCYQVFATCSDRPHALVYVTPPRTADATKPTHVLWLWVGPVSTVVRAVELLSLDEVTTVEPIEFPRSLWLPDTRPPVIRPQRTECTGRHHAPRQRTCREP